jgi:hypothetical protein
MHQILARLSVSLASSMQLTMTIRRSLTPTEFSYHSLTNEHSSRVSRSEGEGEGWVGGLRGYWFYAIALWLHAGTLLVKID